MKKPYVTPQVYVIGTLDDSKLESWYVRTAYALFRAIKADKLERPGLRYVFNLPEWFFDGDKLILQEPLSLLRECADDDETRAFVERIDAATNHEATLAMFQVVAKSLVLKPAGQA